VKTTKLEALKKIRRQIILADDYVHDNPEWETAKEVLDCLLDREQILANICQVEIFQAELERMKNAG